MEIDNTNPEGEVSEEALLERMAAFASSDGEEEAPEENESPAPVDEEPEETEDEEPRVRRLKVKIDGQETELPEDEVAAGYQRQQDYTKKTQEVAEQRKAVEAERQQVQQERAIYAQRLQQLAQELAPPQIDWDALKDDPFAFNDALTKEWARQQKAQQVQAEQARVYQQQQHEDGQRHADHLRKEAARLAERIPEYADPEKRKVVQAAIRTYAQTIGFSEDELSNATDSRAVEVLNKARQWDALQERMKHAPKPTATQTAKPGAARVPVNQGRKAIERLKQSGSDADALAALKSIL